MYSAVCYTVPKSVTNCFLVLSKNVILTMMAKKLIIHYAFLVVLPASFSVVWHVSNKQIIDITIRKRVDVFIIMYLSE